MRRCCCSAIAGRDERDSTSAPVPVPGLRRASCRTSDDEAAARLRGVRLGLPRQYFVEGHGARRRGARPRGRGGAGSGRRGDRRRRPAAHRLRPGHLLHHRAGRGVGQPGALRRHPLRPSSARGGDVHRRTTWRRAAAASAPRSSAASCSARTRSRPATTTPTT